MIKLKKERNKKIVSDRCPYDVCAYVSDPEKQHLMVREYMSELEALFAIRVKTIFVRVPFSLARKRVRERLIREPWRKNYHEDDDAFLKMTWSYYEDHASEWDHVIENDLPIDESVGRLTKIIGAR